MSLGNSNSPSHCSLFRLSFLFRHVLLSKSSSCSFPNALSLQLSPFFFLISLIHLFPELQALICPLGFPHFYPFCCDALSLQHSAIISSLSWHLPEQLGSEGAGMCPGVKLALCLPPPKPLPLSGGSWPEQSSPRSTKNNPCGDLCYQLQIKG